jgi:selenocysteine lyase/cysteine desulfurase
MKLNRRSLLKTSLAASVASQLACEQGTEAAPPLTLGDLSSARDDFPRSTHGVYMNHASQHPVSRQTARVMQQYADYLAHECTRAGWYDASEEAKAFAGARKNEVKQLFGKLINADPSEIAFCLSTTVGENIVANGMGIQESGGNVVTNDLHYSSCLYSYKMRQERGLDVRIVKHRDWQLDPADFEKVVDGDTKLVALTLVSNVNGLLAPVKEIADIAHRNGAYVYADIIQGCGAVPIDVKAMGIDFAACSTYKWLMGLRGFAYLYVREDLQGTVVKPTQFGGGVGFNYAPWVETPDSTQGEITYSPKMNASQYEVGNVSSVGCVCQHEALNFIHRVGVDAIQAHVKPLTDYLQEEMPKIGYASITPKGNRSSITTFRVPDPKEAEGRLNAAKIEVTLRFGNQMRVSVSVMNTQQDVESLVKALA